MIHISRFLVISLACLALQLELQLQLFAADSPGSRLLEGDWVPVKAELSGKPLPEAVLKTISMKLGEGTYDVSVSGHPDKGTYEIDPAASPKSITIKGTEGPNKGRTIPAIYEVDSKTLRICYDLSGAARPKEFKTETGTGLYLVTYEKK